METSQGEIYEISLLATVASAAFVASGAVAMAQENPRLEKPGAASSEARPAGEKHEGETRTGQATHGESAKARLLEASGTLASGNLHIPRENASRIAENLVRRGHRERLHFSWCQITAATTTSCQ